MDDLIAFLRARLNEDERAATHARGTIPIRRPGDGSGNARPGRRIDEHTLDMYSAWFRPERMLRDIEAKRRILAVVLPEVEGMESQIDLEWGVGGGPTDDASGPLLRLLALPYADHPAYREEWRPPA